MGTHRLPGGPEADLPAGIPLPGRRERPAAPPFPTAAEKLESHGRPTQRAGDKQLIAGTRSRPRQETFVPETAENGDPHNEAGKPAGVATEEPKAVTGRQTREAR